VDADTPAHPGEFFPRLGFARPRRHRSKNVTLYRQGDIHLILNAGPDSFKISFGTAQIGRRLGVEWHCATGHVLDEERELRSGKLERLHPDHLSRSAACGHILKSRPATSAAYQARTDP
jgi:hypothetical protein